MKAFIEKWDIVEGRISALLLGISVSLAFYEVLSRFLLHTSIDWSAEIILYAVAWSIFFGSSKLIKEDGHVRVSALLNLLSPERQYVLLFLGACLSFIFMVVITGAGVQQVRDAFVKGYISESSLKIPMWIPYLVMPLGGAILSLRLIERIITLARKIHVRNVFADPLFFAFLFFCASIIILLRMDYDITVILLFGLIVLLVLAVPVAFALGVTCLAVIYFGGVIPLSGSSSKMFQSIINFSYLAIPFFILSGAFMTRGGIAEPLLNFAYGMLKRVTGGLAIAVMVACIIFAALSGASAAIAAAMGIMAIPLMMEKGYPKRFSMGLICAGGTLGVLIPPSTILILYGAVSGESIADLFMAGFVPGVILGIALCVLAYIVCRVKGFGLVDPNDHFSMRELGRNFVTAIWAIIMPVIILGGIYIGFFTPTEAAAAAVFYALFVCKLTYKKLRLKEFLPILEESARLTSLIYFIIMTSTLFSFLVTMEQLSNKALELVTSMNIQPWLFILIVNLTIFFMGCFLGPGAIILITVPILYPMLSELNIHPIHFGILMTINMELAFITPPFGMNLFVMSGVCKEPITEVVKGELPFLLLMLASLLVISYVPAVSLIFIK
jgi:C4-dicarboxylate transporter DctM subunit